MIKLCYYEILGNYGSTWKITTNTDQYHEYDIMDKWKTELLATVVMRVSQTLAKGHI